VDIESERNFEALTSAVQEGRATVLIGAGLAQHANLPGWRGLLEGLYKAAGLTPQPFRSRTAARQIQTLRDNLKDNYLPALRTLLEPPGLRLPDSYRMISDVPFRRFATTNIDELLYIMATVLRRDGADTIFEYPSRDFLDRLHFYLHGRLSVAKDGNDLVLCGSDYYRAYEANGEARHAIETLLATPFLFLGSSLTDPDLDHLLRELENHRISSMEIGGLRAERYATEPKWFAILAANLDELVSEVARRYIPEEEIPRLVREKAEELSPVRTIWYKYDSAHRGLNDLLERLRARTRRPQARGMDTFLASAEELEELAALTAPTLAQVERVILLLRLPANRRHFFQRASSSWLPILWEKEELLVFDEPQLGGDGNYHASGWDAAEYVGRCADLYPQTTLDIIQRIQTQNWLVIAALARALQSLPSDVIVQAVPCVDEWLDGRFASASFASVLLVGLLDRLIMEQQWDAAVALFRVLAKWKAVDDGEA
jgi:hypothetical protein